MANNSYYKPYLDQTPPTAHSEAFPMHSMKNGYSNLPSKPIDDDLNSQVNISAQEPLRPHKTPSQFDRLTHRKREKLKRYLRLVQQASKVLTTLFSLVMFGLTAYIQIKFQITKGTLRDDRGPWPKNPKLWPTIMLLVASGLTLITTTVMLFAYCCCYQKTQTSWKITVARYAVHIVSWAIVAFLYRYEKGLNGKNNDLWGWSCAEEATAIQTEFNGVVNFKFLCSTQACFPIPRAKTVS